MAAQRVGFDVAREQRFHCSPDGIEHFGIECAHNVMDLHLVVGLGAPNIPVGPPWRPVDGPFSAYPARPLSLGRRCRPETSCVPVMEDLDGPAPAERISLAMLTNRQPLGLQTER